MVVVVVVVIILVLITVVIIICLAMLFLFLSFHALVLFLSRLSKAGIFMACLSSKCAI